MSTSDTYTSKIYLPYYDTTDTHLKYTTAIDTSDCGVITVSDHNIITQKLTMTSDFYNTIDQANAINLIAYDSNTDQIVNNFPLPAAVPGSDIGYILYRDGDNNFTWRDKSREPLTKMYVTDLNLDVFGGDGAYTVNIPYENFTNDANTYYYLLNVDITMHIEDNSSVIMNNGNLCFVMFEGTSDTIINLNDNTKIIRSIVPISPIQNTYIHFTKEIQIKENLDTKFQVGNAKIALCFGTYNGSETTVSAYNINNIVDYLYGVFKFSQVTQIGMINRVVTTDTTTSG